ncbi:MAG: hypothetical protein EB084_11890 [Proteobacteria bacterium]|nr:hypothetical protein [Pseudomonadota bacterium]
MSLIEVVIAVTVLAAALFSLGVLIPRSVLHLHNKGFEAVAAQLAERLLEGTRGLDPASVPNGLWDSWAPFVSQSSDTANVPAHAGSARRQFPPVPYPADGLAPYTVSAIQNGQPCTVSYYFRVEVKAPVSAGAARSMQVTVCWLEQSGGGVSNARSLAVSSEVGL